MMISTDGEARFSMGTGGTAAMGNLFDFFRKTFASRLPNQPESSLIGFGDRVQVRSTSETLARGLAKRVGRVYGQTTPSVTGEETLGEPKEDYAVNVFFEELGEGFWFAEDLLEFVDHAPGTDVKIDGLQGRLTRNADGGWEERST
jgi:hypothetical protein